MQSNRQDQQLKAKEKIILNIVQKKKDISFDKHIDIETPVIIDFFNIYCSIIKFNKFKTFSRETFVLCLKLLLKKFKKHKNVIIVAKNIFEVEIEYIMQITMFNSNIRYIIVEDLHLPKGDNRERDDYVCLLLNSRFDNKCVIITNDKYKNMKQLMDKTKELKIHTYYKGQYTHSININSEFIKQHATSASTTEVNTVQFKYLTY